MEPKVNLGSYGTALQNFVQNPTDVTLKKLEMFPSDLKKNEYKKATPEQKQELIYLSNVAYLKMGTMGYNDGIPRKKVTGQQQEIFSAVHNKVNSAAKPLTDQVHPEGKENAPASIKEPEPPKVAQPTQRAARSQRPLPKAAVKEAAKPEAKPDAKVTAPIAGAAKPAETTQKTDVKQLLAIAAEEWENNNVAGTDTKEKKIQKEDNQRTILLNLIENISITDAELKSFYDKIGIYSRDVIFSDPSVNAAIDKRRIDQRALERIDQDVAKWEANRPSKNATREEQIQLGNKNTKILVDLINDTKSISDAALKTFLDKAVINPEGGFMTKNKAVLKALENSKRNLDALK